MAATPMGLAAVPVGGGGAWPDNESTRRAKLAARTARGRAAAHGHTKQWPGLVLWAGCFEGCWLLLVVLCPLVRVLVG